MWDGPAQKIWCAVNLDGMGSVLRPQLKSRKTETYAFGCAVTYPQQKDGRLTAVKPTVDLRMKRFMLILTSQRFGSYTSHWLTSCAQMYLSPAGHARGCVFTLAHSSPSPRPPTTTHTDSGLGLINRIYAAPVSALSPPLAGGDDLWTLWMTSGPFARPLWLPGFIFWFLSQFVSTSSLALIFPL